MKSSATGVAFFFALVFYVAEPVFGQERTGLDPGWLSLDGSVGVVDREIQKGKSALEKALGININGFLDSSYTWSSNHPGFGNDDDLGVRVFDLDHNEVAFNHFNLSLDNGISRSLPKV